ncbi:MAG: MoaD/ThiS family protein [Candidatus Methanomethylicus sp.]|nr:MoaD/ThiS family protein [Candidatus Methanomethylicus sp.]
MALTIRVKYLAVLRGLAKTPERNLSLDGNSLSDLLIALRNTEEDALKLRFFSQDGTVRPDVLVFINDVESSLLGGTKAALKDGDEITFLPSVHGG